MRVQFDANDSIYKIFKTIRKIPSYRSIKIFIDPAHEFFTNDRWGKEILESLSKNNIDATFIVKDLKSKRYFEDLDAPVMYQQQNIFYKMLRSGYQFVFATRDFHNSLLIKQNYISYLVIATEVAVIGGVLYLFWGMISPNAKIVVRPGITIDAIVYSYQYYPLQGKDTYHA